MTDTTRQDEAAVHRAARAQTILTDPMVQDALAFVRDQVRDAFFDLDPADAGRASACCWWTGRGSNSSACSPRT